MPVTAIPDFTDSECWAIRTSLSERFGRDIEVEQAETELRLNPHSTQLVPCPTVYWKVDDCNFLICKTGDSRYRNQFFYRVHQVFGTGIEEYDNITECVVTLLQVQADHSAMQQQE